MYKQQLCARLLGSVREVINAPSGEQMLTLQPRFEGKLLLTPFVTV